MLHNKSAHSNAILLSLSSLNLNFSKSSAIASSSSSFMSENNSADHSSLINHVNFKLNDFQCKLEIPADIVGVGRLDSVHVLGPLTLKSYLNHCLAENEVFSFVDFGSFNFSFNRQLLMFANELEKFIDENFSKVLFFLIYVSMQLNSKIFVF